MFYKNIFIKRVVLILITELLVFSCILSACGQKGKTTAELNLSGKKAAELFSSLNQFAEINHNLFCPEESSNVDNTSLPATPDNSPFVIKDGILLSYKGYKMEVVVPEGVERIGKEAFWGNKSLQRIVLPEGLCSIGESAFSGCSNLVEVQLPKEVSDIRQRAFSDCEKLEKINLQNVKSIARWAFRDCRSLCSVNLEGITKLSDGAFYRTGLEEIRGMGELSEIGDNVFYGTPIIEHYSTLFDTDLLIIQHVLLAGYCSEGDVVIPDGVEIIAPRAFEDAVGVRSVVCGGKVREIGERAFAGCLNLEKFWMGDSVTKIGEQIFRDATRLCDLRISEQLRVIPDGFLSECSALRMVTLPERCAVSGWFSLGYAVSKGGAMVTLPPRKKVFSFLKQPWEWRGDYKIYTTELPEDSEWQEAAKTYGWSLDFLELTVKEVVLAEGETYKLAFNSGAKAYWKSLDENVVLVDCDGGLTAHGTGETDVVATIYGTEYKCHVVVDGKDTADSTQKQETEKITRNAYFLNEKTIFSAAVPENWYDEIVFLNNLSQAKIHFRCVASEMEGFYGTNFFDITVGEKTKNRQYEEYEGMEFQYIDGQKGKRYTWEYTDELMEELCYHADVLVLPGETFLVRSSEYQDPYLTVGRYEKNKHQIEAFYDSILYQEQAEQIGRNLKGELKEHERIRVHLRNDFLNVEMVVPEGIFYETETNLCEFGGTTAREFRLRLYLDDGKKNYVDICSDLCEMIAERIIIEKGYQAEFLDGGELVYCYEWRNAEQMWGEWKGDNFRQCWYTFGHRYKAGAKICVEERKPELYELALEIVRSICVGR